MEDLYSQRLLFVRVDLNSSDENTLTSAKTFAEDLLGHEELHSSDCLIIITKDILKETRKYLFEGKIGKYELIEFVNKFLDRKEIE